MTTRPEAADLGDWPRLVHDLVQRDGELRATMEQSQALLREFAAIREREVEARESQAAATQALADAEERRLRWEREQASRPWIHARTLGLVREAAASKPAQNLYALLLGGLGAWIAGRWGVL